MDNVFEYTVVVFLDVTPKLDKTFPVGWVGGWVRKDGNKAQTQPAGAGAWLSLAKIETAFSKSYILQDKQKDLCPGNICPIC